MADKNVQKKVFAAILCASMSATALAGCGNEAVSESSAPASQETSQTVDNSDPLAETVSLSIGMQSSPNIEDLETNWFTTYLEKELNVDLSFVLLPTNATEAKTKWNLMASSGEKLPDILNMGLDEMSATDYGSKGIFIDLTSYFSNPDIMPKFNNIPAENLEYIRKCITASDGKMYAIPGYNRFEWNEACYRTYINLDWMNKAGVTAPTTTDEFYEVLKTFATTDMNGNGKQDEIAMAGGSGWGQDPIVYLMNAFLYANPDKAYLDVKDGKIIASFTQPEWKNGLEYINKLVSEGLLSPLSFTQDGTQLKSMVNVEGGMVGVVPAGSYSTFDTTIVSDPLHDGGYTLLAPLKGPEGKSYTPQNPTTPNWAMFITKDCKNVDRAVRLGDWFMERESHIIAERGEKGVDWSDDPEIMKDYIMSPTQEEAGYSIEFVEINYYWGQPQNNNWQGTHPGYSTTLPKTTTSNIRKDSDAAKSGGIYSAGVDFDQMYVPVFRPTDELIVKLSYTEDETKKLADIKTVIDEYVKEQTVAFATGKRPLTDWDKYLAELENMGLPRYLEITQAAYDRF